MIFCYNMNHPDLSGLLGKVCFVSPEAKVNMEKQHLDFMHHISFKSRLKTHLLLLPLLNQIFINFLHCTVIFIIQKLLLILTALLLYSCIINIFTFYSLDLKWIVFKCFKCPLNIIFLNRCIYPSYKYFFFFYTP